MRRLLFFLNCLLVEFSNTGSVGASGVGLLASALAVPVGNHESQGQKLTSTTACVPGTPRVGSLFRERGPLG